MSINKDLVEKISKMPMAILSLMDENDMVYTIPINDFIVKAEHITLKRPKSFTHKFAQDQKVGICWPDFLINENTGRLGPFEHYTFWGVANEISKDEIRVVLSPKFHFDNTANTFEPSVEEKAIDRANQFRSNHNLKNAYEIKGVI